MGHDLIVALELSQRTAPNHLSKLSGKPRPCVGCICYQVLSRLGCGGVHPKNLFRVHVRQIFCHEAMGEYLYLYRLLQVSVVRRRQQRGIAKAAIVQFLCVCNDEDVGICSSECGLQLWRTEADGSQFQRGVRLLIKDAAYFSPMLP